MTIHVIPVNHIAVKDRCSVFYKEDVSFLSSDNAKKLAEKDGSTKLIYSRALYPNFSFLLKSIASHAINPFTKNLFFFLYTQNCEQAVTELLSIGLSPVFQTPKFPENKILDGNIHFINREKDEKDNWKITFPVVPSVFLEEEELYPIPLWAEMDDKCIKRLEAFLKVGIPVNH